MRRALLLLTLLFPLVLYSQLNSSKITFVTSDPSGSCSKPQSLRYNIANGKLWGCDGTWTQIGAGGGGGGTPGGGDTAVQFNHPNGTFAGDETNFAWDPITKALLIQSPANTGAIVLDIENVTTTDPGSFPQAANFSTTSNNSSGSAGDVFGVVSRVVQNGAGSADNLIAMDLNAQITGGGSVVTMIGLRVNNILAGTNNYAIKTGLGLVSFGDSVKGSGSAPALTSCGSSPAISGSNISGTVTEGTIATGCVITFNGAPLASAPHCTVNSEAGLVFSYAISSSAITVTNVGALSSTKLDYVCVL